MAAADVLNTKSNTSACYDFSGVRRAQIPCSMLVKKGGVRRSAHHALATALACSSPCSVNRTVVPRVSHASTPVLAARAARREKLGEARSENLTFHCDPPSESAVFAMHAAVQTPKVVRQPAHHCELGLRPRGAQQRRLRGQNVPTPVRSAVFRSRSSGGAARDLSPWGPPEKSPAILLIAMSRCALHSHASNLGRHRG